VISYASPSLEFADSAEDLADATVQSPDKQTEDLRWFDASTTLINPENVTLDGLSRHALDELDAEIRHLLATGGGEILQAAINRLDQVSTLTSGRFR
jgi:hypothetical protein